MILFRSLDTIVLEDEHGIVVRRRGLVNVMAGTGSLVLGALLWSFAETQVVGGPLLVLGALNLLLAAVLIVAPGNAILRQEGGCRIGRRRYPLEAIRSVGLATLQVGSVKAVSVRLEVGSERPVFVGGQTENLAPELETVVQRIQSLLASPMRQDTGPRHYRQEGQNFRAAILIVLGLVISVSVYLLRPSLVFDIGDWDVRVWHLGLWIGAVGLTELLGWPLFDLMDTKARNQALRVLLLVVWFGSYVVVCRV